jgi:hypothetical protein
MGAARGRSSLSRAGGRRTCGSAWRGGWEGSGELGFGIWAGSTMVGRQVKTKLRGVWVGGYVVLLYLFELPSHPYLPCPPPLPPPPPHGLVRIAGRRHLPAPDAHLLAARPRPPRSKLLDRAQDIYPRSQSQLASLPSPSFSRTLCRRRRIPPSELSRPRAWTSKAPSPPCCMRRRVLPPRSIVSTLDPREVAIRRASSRRH